MCLNFAYSDIYQDYINRLSINCHNNCDYDQIRRSTFIPREDFFKYYNFPFYDNNFELESEQFYEDEIWGDSDDDVSGVEEVGKFALERYDAWTYKSRTSRIKNLIHGIPDRKGGVLSSGKDNYGGDDGDTVYRRDDNNGTDSKSYTSQLFQLMSQRKNCHLGIDNYHGSGESRVTKLRRSQELLSESIRGDEMGGDKKGCLEKLKTQVFSFCKKIYDPRDPSFMSNFNIYFLNYHDISKKKIKNAFNEDYMYMVQNLAEAQGDPLVGRYYKGVHMVQKKQVQNRETHPNGCAQIKWREDHFKEEEQIHGQVRHSVDELEDTKHQNSSQSSQKGEKGTSSATSNGFSEQCGMEHKAKRHGRRVDKKVRLSGNWDKTPGAQDKTANSRELQRSASNNMKRLCSEEIEIYFKKVLKNEIINFNQKRINKRDRWSSLCQFVCSCIGASLTAQCYLDLPPISSSLDYVLLLLLLLFCYLFIGLPILQMEYALGQLSQGCIINGLSFLKKKYRGVAIASLIISFCILSRSAHDTVDTAIVVVTSAKKTLPWNLNQCEGIPLKGDCLRNGKCIWVTARTERNDTFRGNFPQNIFYPDQRFGILDTQMRSERNGFILTEISPAGDYCTSDATTEWHYFFTKEVKLVWKIGAVFLITLALYFLLRVEGMCLTQCLQYTFFLFFLIALFQIFVLSYELKSNRWVPMNGAAGDHPKNGHTNGSIFFSTKYFLYLNFEVIGKVCTLVLMSLNCSTGINYLFSSYSNIGDNLFVSAWYVVLGSFFGIGVHIVHYYVCVQLLSSVLTGRGTVEVMIPPRYDGSMGGICSLHDLFSKTGDPINNFIVYMASLTRVKFQNMMSFTYFLCSLLALLTSSALHLKGIILVLKESRKFKGIKKKVITLFVIVVYFLWVCFYLSPCGYNTNLIMKYATSSCVYLFVVFAQVVRLREKLYFLYIFNVDTLRTRLNKILYGRRRTYDLEKREEHPLALFLFQKLTIHWCVLTKFFISQILLTIVLSNVLYNVHFCLDRGITAVGSHSSNQYRRFAQDPPSVHSYLRTASNDKHGFANLNAFSSGASIVGGTSMKGGITSEQTYQHVFTNAAPKGGANKMKDTKSDTSCGACAHLTAMIATVLLTLSISLFTFVRPNKMNCLACAPTNTWTISDVDFKRMNPANYAYTRPIYFFEEIFPIERIMPCYVWTHINKHIEKAKPVTSLDGDDQTEETIYDKSFSYLNKNDFENYIFNLIDRGSKLSHFSGIKGQH
ncbi:hypothetical protein AK88_00064 [Plasmodium fragile]|uniref:Uncharacterized protein n=1 Tax=Plasmodium fragile TaxID=5857 RepID=A0A0D9QUD5_PLAFR|nr:uncharacterized protein AK88_00064 [Plasmodium fragile]KJP90216.1 hypothetical protein AK88_00064 [Plasmodium fragile]